MNDCTSVSVIKHQQISADYSISRRVPESVDAAHDVHYRAHTDVHRVLLYVSTSAWKCVFTVDDVPLVGVRRAVGVGSEVEDAVVLEEVGVLASRCVHSHGIAIIGSGGHDWVRVGVRHQLTTGQVHAAEHGELAGHVTGRGLHL